MSSLTAEFAVFSADLFLYADSLLEVIFTVVICIRFRCMQVLFVDSILYALILKVTIVIFLTNRRVLFMIV